MSKFKDDELVESFVAGGEVQLPSHARGLPSHPAVQKYGQYFVPAATPDDEIARVRAKPYIDAGASPPRS